MHGLPIHTCCRTLLQCLRYYCLPQAGLLLTNLHLLTQTVASFTNLFCCLTPLSIFFVNLNLIVTHVAVSWWGSIYFFLLYADAQMQNFAARLCIVCTFAFFVTRWCKVVYVLQIYICLQTLCPVISNNYMFANNAPSVEFFTGCRTLLRYLPVHISCRKLAYCYSHVLMQGWASFANLFVCER